MPRALQGRPTVVATALVLLALGLAVAAGGFQLLCLHGSPYYLACGLALCASGLLLPWRPPAALWLYGAFLLATVAWAVHEARWDWWQLLPRLDLWCLLGAWLLLPWANRRLSPAGWSGGGVRSGNIALALALACSLVVAGVALAHDEHGLSTDAAAAAAIAARPTQPAAPGPFPTDWRAYGGSAAGNRYSPATQITPENAGRLELAWTYHTRDFRRPLDPGEFANEATPLKAGGKLYLCTAHDIVIALDPDTGHEQWRYDPGVDTLDARGYQHMICRGVAYYDANAYPRATPAVGACARRIYAPTAKATIVALDADTGRPCEGFGEHGIVDLKRGHGTVVPGYLNPTSPPLVTQHVLIAGASVTDNGSTDEPSGVIMGFDIDTGALRWNFDSGNPAHTAPLAPGEHYVRNSPNMWSVASADEALGLAYFPMGNQTPDIWGGHRIPAGERFNSAIVALDIATGKLRWVYQTVHHDLWDMDIGGQPTLVDLDTPRGRVPALVASTKRGDLYVLDRRDGRLLVPAPERPVPQGAAKGDRTSPTQPFSQLSFKPQPLREADMWGTMPLDQLVCRIMFRRLRYEGIFTPPSEQGSLVYPGNYGVFDWGGIAVDPVRQVLVANPNYVAFVSKLYPRAKAEAASAGGSEIGLQPMTGTPYAVDLHPLLSPLGIPCQAPPWGYMAAVDLRTMKRLWMRKNGTVRDSAPLPIPLPLGVPSLGGPLATAGGVSFLGSTLDYYLRAYDTRTGEKLWQARLPAGGQATPMSYVSDRTGRQYVVVFAGGHGSLGTKLGDSVVAYALPR
ncbi:MAG TPA: membrane-bound PQQ-dependent dehydrogenase, glucose/quinate/shikimate family [Luteimonas sp.]|jgi:quinoprotein glucose dehydrogenase|nr:membrane-bound PQQ-dependent dehydrogenase, glucose/quinate/shikimate family [Luteimonas sp.]